MSGPTSERVTCDHCGEQFDRSASTAVFDGTGRALYRCLHCSLWTHGPPPDA